MTECVSVTPRRPTTTEGSPSGAARSGHSAAQVRIDHIMEEGADGPVRMHGDECARGAEGEAKAACAISKPRPGPRSTLAHALHRYLTEGDLRVPVWRILAIFAPNDG